MAVCFSGKWKTLNPMELAELDVYEQLEYMMILLKARAFKRD
ncbi:hypothetical protein [Iningainema tapete]|nr:hypothetical protein [Iningainema tapete]